MRSQIINFLCLISSKLLSLGLFCWQIKHPQHQISEYTWRSLVMSPCCCIIEKHFRSRMYSNCKNTKPISREVWRCLSYPMQSLFSIHHVFINISLQVQWLLSQHWNASIARQTRHLTVEIRSPAPTWERAAAPASRSKLLAGEAKCPVSSSDLMERTCVQITWWPESN